MKILLFGASGMIGRRILLEALRRGHEVTAVARDATRIPDGANAISADILDPKQVEVLVDGHDVVVNATAARGDAGQFLEIAESLKQGLAPRRDVRLIVVGGAGSLEIQPGLQLVDSPNFPADWKEPASKLRDALEIYRTSDLEWTFLCPPMMIAPGERTGKYREGKDQVLFDDAGESKISAEDFAVAVLDEVTAPKHRRERFTVAA